MAYNVLSVMLNPTLSIYLSMATFISTVHLKMEISFYCYNHVEYLK